MFSLLLLTLVFSVENQFRVPSGRYLEQQSYTRDTIHLLLFRGFPQISI